MKITIQAESSMKNQIQLDEFKQQVAQIYDRRRETYDKGDFHPRLANTLIKYARIKPGEKILDIATGTGLVAIEAATIVGKTGKVIGVDISTGLLEVAKKKIALANLTNIELILADAETLKFPKNSFDLVLCCSALPLFPNVRDDLILWRSFLVYGGSIGLQVYAKTAAVAGVILQKVAKRYGIELIFSDLTGTKDRCYSLLQEAGFKNIEINSDQLGNYISLENAKKTWQGSLNHPLSSQLKQLSKERIERAKSEYFAELEALVTDKGIWNDMTVYYVLGSK